VEGVLLVTGSLFVVGEALTAWDEIQRIQPAADSQKEI
jgi:hypothetical protein